jgi:diguanylate cyclase (GGDEF)-like protein
VADKVNEQALTILYDLATVIGGEIAVEPLLIKTVQRLLFHTGFPVGLLLSDLRPSGDGRLDGRLDVAIGDYLLAKKQGGRFSLAAALADGGAVLEEAPQLLASLGTRKAQRAFLRLPVKGYGVILLLGPALPASGLPLADILATTTGHLANAITLCQSHEKEVQHRVERIAYYDPLTGLPNSIFFADILRQTLLRSRPSNAWLAVLSIDIDDFKPFNERYGASMGNRALVAMGQWLQSHLRPGEVVAHLLGDEFALLLPELKSRAEIDQRIGEILQVRKPQLEIGGQIYELSASMGVAIHPADADDADTLLRYAQMAMHQAKQDARGEFRLFDAELNRRVHERRHLLNRLEQALGDGSLRLFYQPKVDLLGGQVHGFEALVRWFDGERGMVPPDRFLPEVTDSDFIVHLGDWALREALRQAVAWRQSGIDTCISVNIAARHLQLPDFVDRVRQALAAVPSALPTNLEIEILESSTFDSLEHVRAVISECEQMGVRFSIDDFGTGYSSLAYLSQLPTAIVKIDQMFVRNIFDNREDPAIIQAIMQIAEVFNRQVVAEGVETTEHGILLISMGCRIGQGFGIGRPMPAAAVPAWVAGYKPPPEWAAASRLRWHSELYQLFRIRHAHGLWRDDLLLRLGAGEQGAALPAGHGRGLDEWVAGYLQVDSTSPFAQDLQAAYQQLQQTTAALLSDGLNAPAEQDLRAASRHMVACIDTLARFPVAPTGGT